MTLPLRPRNDRPARAPALRWLRPHLLATLAITTVLVACGSSPPVNYYQLRAATPDRPATNPASPATARILQIGAVQMPEYLERESMVVPQGQAGLQVLHNDRWAEPLRDAFPRVLGESLAAQVPSLDVWTTPPGSGLQPTWMMRLEVLRFEADPTLSAVHLTVRATLTSAGTPAGMPVVRRFDLTSPVHGSGLDALAAAHGSAVTALATQMAPWFRP